MFSNEIFRYSETKTSMENRDNPHPPPPLLSINFFSLPEIFWNTEWFPGEVFSVLWDKKKFRQNREASPLLCLKIFETRILSKDRSVLLRILSALWDKNFSTEFSDIPFLCIKFCDTRNFLKHRSVPQRNFLVLCDKSFRRRNVIPPSLWCIKFFDTRNFLIHWSVPQRNFLVLCDKSFRRRNVIPPSLWCIKFFDTRNFLIHWSVPQRNFSVLCDKKFSTEKRDTPPLSDA